MFWLINSLVPYVWGIRHDRLVHKAHTGIHDLISQRMGFFEFHFVPFVKTSDEKILFAFVPADKLGFAVAAAEPVLTEAYQYDPQPAFAVLEAVMDPARLQALKDSVC